MTSIKTYISEEEDLEEAAWDDVNNEDLDIEGVRGGRKEELDFINKEGVYGKRGI